MSTELLIRIAVFVFVALLLVSGVASAWVTLRLYRYAPLLRTERLPILVRGLVAAAGRITFGFAFIATILGHFWPGVFLLGAMLIAPGPRIAVWIVMWAQRR